MSDTCAVDGCDRAADTRKMCRGHYMRWYKRGEVWPEVPLRKGNRLGWEQPVCDVDGCDQPAEARGMCNPHYQRWYHHGDPLWTPPARETAHCAVEGCQEQHAARTWCKGHYERWYLHGDPTWERPAGERVCEIEDCGRVEYAIGLCVRHHSRYHSGHDATRYRQRSGVCGGRCELCRWAHNREHREGRRQRAEAELPFEERREIIARLWKGELLDRVCAEHGIAPRRIWGLARSIPGFSGALEAALMGGRDPDMVHGEVVGYRAGCRCRECRQAKARDR